MKKFKLGVLPYIILLCILTFTIIKIRDTRLVSSEVQIDNPSSLDLIEKEEWKQLYASNVNIKNGNTLIIYNPEDINSLNTYKNIEYVLNTINVNTIGVKITEQNKYSKLSDFDTMIICIDNVNELEYGSQKIKNWVKNGNGILFAMPLQKDEKLSEYTDLLGIEKGTEIGNVEYKNMMLTDDFLIRRKG